MLTVYVVSAVVAGVLVLLSMLGGDHGADHGGADFHHEVGGDHDHDHDHGGAVAEWVPFFSLRFYTYFFAAFGTTGLLLHFFSGTPGAIGVWIAAGVGLLSGLGVWLLTKLLRRSEGTSAATDSDVLGKEGQVLVPINGMNPGRIRCVVRGDIIDFLAVSEERITIPAGHSVVVVAMEDGRAMVVPREAIFTEDTLTQKAL